MSFTDEGFTDGGYTDPPLTEEEAAEAPDVIRFVGEIESDVDYEGHVLLTSTVRGKLARIVSLEGEY
jgi:hypothetical protein